MEIVRSAVHRRKTVGAEHIAFPFRRAAHIRPAGRAEGSGVVVARSIKSRIPRRVLVPIPLLVKAVPGVRLRAGLPVLAVTGGSFAVPLLLPPGGEEILRRAAGLSGGGVGEHQQQMDAADPEAVAVQQCHLAHDLAVAVAQARAGVVADGEPLLGQLEAGVAAAHRRVSDAHVAAARRADHALADDGIAHAPGRLAVALQHHQLAAETRHGRQPPQLCRAPAVHGGQPRSAQRDQHHQPRKDVSRAQREQLVGVPAHFAASFGEGSFPYYSKKPRAVQIRRAVSTRIHGFRPKKSVFYPICAMCG